MTPFRTWAACCMLSVGAAAVLPAGAAEILVPGDHATLTAAIAAATAGDTITITNGANYAESITIDKPLNVRAAFGNNPTISGSGTDPFVVKIVTGGEGTRFGDAEGGAIEITGDSFDNTATKMVVVSIENAAGTVTLERLLIYGNFNYHNSTTGAVAPNKNRDMNNMVFLGGGGDIVLNFVEIAGGSWGLSFGTPGVVRSIYVNNSIIKSKNFGYFVEDRNRTVSTNCIIMNFVPNWAPVYYNTGVNDVIIFSHCWLNGASGAPPVSIASRRAHDNYADYTIFSTTGNSAAIALGGNSYGGERWHIDHCDFYSSSTVALIAIANAATPPGNRVVEVTNSNLVNLGEGGVISTPTNASGDSLLRVHKNNYFTPAAVRVGANGDFTTYTVDVPVATIRPDYVSVAVGNYTYSNGTLLTAGQGGTPMGSMVNIAAMRTGAVPVELSTFSLQ